MEALDGGETAWRAVVDGERPRQPCDRDGALGGRRERGTPRDQAPHRIDGAAARKGWSPPAAASAVASAASASSAASAAVASPPPFASPSDSSWAAAAAAAASLTRRSAARTAIGMTRAAVLWSGDDAAARQRREVRAAVHKVWVRRRGGARIGAVDRRVGEQRRQQAVARYAVAREGRGRCNPPPGAPQRRWRRRRACRPFRAVAHAALEAPPRAPRRCVGRRLQPRRRRRVAAAAARGGGGGACRRPEAVAAPAAAAPPSREPAPRWRLAPPTASMRRTARRGPRRFRGRPHRAPARAGASPASCRPRAACAATCACGGGGWAARPPRAPHAPAACCCCCCCWLASRSFCPAVIAMPSRCVKASATAARQRAARGVWIVAQPQQRHDDRHGRVLGAPRQLANGAAMRPVTSEKLAASAAAAAGCEITAPVAAAAAALRGRIGRRRQQGAHAGLRYHERPEREDGPNGLFAQIPWLAHRRVDVAAPLVSSHPSRETKRSALQAVPCRSCRCSSMRPCSPSAD